VNHKTALPPLSRGTAHGAQERRPQTGSGRKNEMPVPALPNDLWALDFVSDQFDGGQWFCILAVYDACTLKCLASIADFSLSGRWVARELDLLIAVRARPKLVASDSGGELTSNAILTWTAEARVD